VTTQLSAGVLAAFWRRAGGFLAAFPEKPSGDWCHVTTQLSARLLAAFWRRAGGFPSHVRAVFLTVGTIKFLWCWNYHIPMASTP